MKLIFIYGPPGIGKFTVAKQLARITGYKLFHNHLTNDLVESIFDRGTKIFSKLVSKYRLELIEAAARENIKGLIFTYVYAKPEDDKQVKMFIKGVEKHRGKVYFVRLTCEEKELLRRLKHPQRKKYRKIKNKKVFGKLMNKYDLCSDFEHKNNLVIDNTKLSAKTVAKKIKDYYKL